MASLITCGVTKKQTRKAIRKGKKRAIFSYKIRKMILVKVIVVKKIKETVIQVKILAAREYLFKIAMMKKKFKTVIKNMPKGRKKRAMVGANCSSPQGSE